MGSPSFEIGDVSSVCPGRVFFCGSGKYSIWHVRLNNVAVDFTPT